MKILALITARGGSERLPKKNILKLGGKPLVKWSIDILKDIPEICDILLSTDDKEIAKIGKNEKILVPWLRPKYLSTNKASSLDTALHAINWYQKKIQTFDGLMLIQPTSPFRSIKTIRRAIKLFKSKPKIPVMSVSKIKNHGLKFYKLKNGLMKTINNSKKKDNINSINFYENGLLYLKSPKDLKKSMSFKNGTFNPLIIYDTKENIDIDTKLDWVKAVGKIREI